MNRDRLMADAKALALALRSDGYQPPQPRAAIPVGGDAMLATLKLGVHLALARRPHQRSRRAHRPQAGVDPGGRRLPHPGTVSEQQLLDLEREAFLSLCGERKTLERIQHTLKTGKTLRN